METLELAAGRPAVPSPSTVPARDWDLVIGIWDLVIEIALRE